MHIILSLKKASEGRWGEPLHRCIQSWTFRLSQVNMWQCLDWWWPPRMHSGVRDWCDALRCASLACHGTGLRLITKHCRFTVENLITVGLDRLASKFGPYYWMLPMWWYLIEYSPNWCILHTPKMPVRWQSHKCVKYIKNSWKPVDRLPSLFVSTGVVASTSRLSSKFRHQIWPIFQHYMVQHSLLKP